jgi:hypothetical protein
LSLSLQDLNGLALDRYHVMVGGSYSQTLTLSLADGQGFTSTGRNQVTLNLSGQGHGRDDCRGRYVVFPILVNPLKKFNTSTPHD